MLNLLWSWANPYTLCLYTAVAIFCWYLILALEYEINGGSLGRGKCWVFECLWEDLCMNLPGGSKIKADKIRAIVNIGFHNGTLVSLSSDKSWTHEELRRTAEYEKCGKEMFGSALSFWTIRMILYPVLAFIFGPGIVFYTLLAGITLGPIEYGIDLVRKKMAR